MSKAFSKSVRRLFAELVVIVAGVLIALAIDQWRQTTEENSLEQEYLQQLIIDLQATEESVLASEEANDAGGEALRTLVTAFASGDGIEADEITGAIYTMGFNNPVPVLGTLEALVSTGDLRLVHEYEARSAITSYLTHARDFLVAPLYSIEDQFRTNKHRLLTIAAEHGIVYSGGAIDLARSREPDVEAFLGNGEAYVIVLELIDAQSYFSWYRDQLTISSRELRMTLEGEPLDPR